MLYLDNAATTPIETSVLEKMLPWLTEEYGNPGALYAAGRRAGDAVMEARQQVAQLIGAEPEQIIFTSGGSEANNTVLFGTITGLLRKERTQLLLSAVEHDSMIHAAEELMERFPGASFSLLMPAANGSIQIRALTEKLCADTGLVSVMYVNNETGAVNPVKELAALCRSCGVLFHTDCVQAASCLPLDVKELGCDFLSLSAHKLHGPKGVGALYVRDPEAGWLRPLIAGGVMQVGCLRGCTENVAGIVGFGEAAALMRRRVEEDVQHCTRLKNALYHRLFIAVGQICAAKGVEHILSVNGPSPASQGKILNLCLRGIDAETLVLLLDSRGVCISAGSACRSHEQEPSRVLTAMGLSAEQARNSVRISFSRMNGMFEVVEAASIIANCIRALL